MLTYLYIAIGSALGGMARYWCMVTANHYLGNLFPWGTVIVNVLGSFVVGFVAALAISEKIPLSLNTQRFLMVGVCGGYTTFSTFSLDTLKLLQNDEYLKAGANMTVSVFLCLGAVFFGYFVASMITQLKT